MSIIAWIVVGALAGWLASMVTGRNEEMGWMANILVGIVGAFVGGLIMMMLGGGGVTGFNISSILVAFGGAVIVLLLVNMLRGRTA